MCVAMRKNVLHESYLQILPFSQRYEYLSPLVRCLQMAQIKAHMFSSHLGKTWHCFPQSMKITCTKYEKQERTLKGIGYQGREKSLKHGLHFLFTVALLLQASASKRGCGRSHWYNPFFILLQIKIIYCKKKVLRYPRLQSQRVFGTRKWPIERTKLSRRNTAAINMSLFVCLFSFR